MDQSIRFLLEMNCQRRRRHDSFNRAAPPEQNDDDKIGFTLDVAMRLDQELLTDNARAGVVIPILGHSPEDLADSA